MPSHGQHSFLLYPFKTLYFMRKTDPLFAGNSQNILKKAFFWGFTRMFTICSYLSILSNLFLSLSIHSDYTIIYAKKTGTPTEINSPKPPLPISIRRSYFHWMPIILSPHSIPFSRRKSVKPSTRSGWRMNHGAWASHPITNRGWYSAAILKNLSEGYQRPSANP